VNDKCVAFSNFLILNASAWLITSKLWHLVFFWKTLLSSSDKISSRKMRFDDYSNNYPAQIALIWYVHSIFKPMISNGHICAWRKRLNSLRHCHIYLRYVYLRGFCQSCNWLFVTNSVMDDYSVKSRTREKKKNICSRKQLNLCWDQIFFWSSDADSFLLVPAKKPVVQKQTVKMSFSRYKSLLDGRKMWN